jgi:hypothetical protein
MARERVGEYEGRSPSVKTSRLYSLKQYWYIAPYGADIDD